jgi:hypothetical protein
MSEIPTNDEPVFSLDCAGIGTCEWNVVEGVMQWDTQMHTLFGACRFNSLTAWTAIAFALRPPLPAEAKDHPYITQRRLVLLRLPRRC